MGEEAELLRGMIADREQRIATILRKTEEQKEKELRLAKELEQVSQSNLEREIQLQTEKTRLLQSHQAAADQLEAMQRDLKQQGSSLQAYAGAVKKQQQGAKGGGVDTSYVMRMQAQLCKAMHSLGIGDHQMELAKSHADALIKMQRDAVAAVREEKSQVELEFMNELMKRDTDLRGVENGYKDRVQEIQKDVEAVQKQMDGSGSDSDSDEDDEDDNDEEEEEDDEEEEEEDEEEKEAKEELMKMLQEKREDIQKLEKKNSEQADTIQELEEQLEEMGGTSSHEKVTQREVASPENSSSEGEDDEDEEGDDDSNATPHSSSNGEIEGDESQSEKDESGSEPTSDEGGSEPGED